MALTIDPQTRIILVPQADLTLVSGANYQLNVDDFRRELKDIEDSPEGIYLVDTHRHTAPVTLSGTTYARFVEIINGYRVEFEDGQYSVALIGGNNNIVDVLVQNQVSVVANNSSGLIESDLIEFSSFQDKVIIDVNNGEPGTNFPAGTSQQPVDNLADALIIANERGFDTLFIKGNLTIANGESIAGFTVESDSTAKGKLTFEAGSSCFGSILRRIEVEGTMLAPALCELVLFGDVTGATTGSAGVITLRECLFDGTITLSPNLEAELKAIDCYSGVSGVSRPVFDMNGANVDFLIRNYSGGLEIRNMNVSGKMASVDMHSGHVFIDSTCTDGTLTVRGISKITDNSTGTTVDLENLVQPVKVATKSVVQQFSQV